MRTRRLLILTLTAAVTVGGASSAGAGPGRADGASGDDVFGASSHRTEVLPDGRLVGSTWVDDGTEDGRWVDDGAGAVDTAGATGDASAADPGTVTPASAEVTPVESAPAAAPVVARPTFAG